ncbi:MAG: hypothetical protein ACXVCY_02360 [Pseudobdellovibrionaceae bacterium]
MRTGHLFTSFIIISAMVGGCTSVSLKSHPCNSRAPSSTLLCEEVFADENMPEPLFSLNSNYDHLGVEELRLGPQKNGSYPLLRKKIYNINLRWNSVIIAQILEPGYKTSNTAFAKSQISDLVLQKNQESWNATVNEAIEFVLNQYAERREHWPAEFREKLRKIAQDYKFNSTYITIKHKAESKGVTSILGTLRLIEERDGRLPMEDYLRISLNSHGAKKFEPGNFAVDKSVNQYAFGEIILHLIENILEKSKNNETHFYTYADRQSLMMYKMLGFRPVPLSDLNPAPGVVIDEKGRINKDEVLWTPLEASRSDMETLLANYLSGSLPTHAGESEIRQALNQRFQAIDTNAVPHDYIFRGIMLKSDETEPCELHLVPEEGYFRFLFGRTNRDFKKFRGWNSFIIPQEGLTEGYHIEQNIGGTRSAISYYDGVLTYLQLDGSGLNFSSVYQIKITPDLSTVEWINAQSNPGTSFQSEFKASF